MLRITIRKCEYIGRVTLDYAGYVDGVFVKGEGSVFQVENPSDESIVAEFAGVSAAQVDAAIGSARRAFDAGLWRACR